MSCAGCSTKSKDGTPGGCGSGGCSSGGCNRLNTYDWLAGVKAPAEDDFDLVEVSFKNGSRKTFFHNPNRLDLYSHEWVVVESGNGYDVGRVSLQGELVKLQMKKKRIKKNAVFHKIIRKAHERDMEKLHEARALEKEVMIRARFIARSLGLNMKIGDVEFQGDKRKATFYYTAQGRVDFRELIRHYAKDFRVKIEMRQIGARQESAKIGGLGPCGRELCCSTWLSDFKSVSTSAARYQNLAINQSKLSGQCGRLKCCLNYELNTYMEALKGFPKKADYLETEAGSAKLLKMDIFKRLMYYIYKDKRNNRGRVFALDVERVNEIIAMNKKGQKPAELRGIAVNDDSSEDVDLGFSEDVTGHIELPAEERKRRRNRGRRNKSRDNTKPQLKGEAKGKSRTEDKPVGKPTGKTPQDKQGNQPEAKKSRNTRRRGRGGKPKHPANNAQDKQGKDANNANKPRGKEDTPKPLSGNPQKKDGSQPKTEKKRPGRRNSRNRNNRGNKKKPPAPNDGTKP